MTLEQFDGNNKERIEKNTMKHKVKLVQQFRQFIVDKTDNFKKQMVFSEGSLFTSLYEGAISEMNGYDSWCVSIDDIFNNPDSHLRQVLQCYKTW